MTKFFSPENQELLGRAIELHNGGDLTAAGLIYKQLLHAYPANAKLLSMLGTVECQTGNLPEGARLLEQSLALDPNQPDTCHNRGNALLELERFTEAAASFERAASLKPDYADAWMGRGVALNMLNHYSDALACFGRALSLRPNYATAYNNRGNSLLGLQNLEAALADYVMAARLDPNSADAHHNQGVILSYQNQHEDALHAYARTLTLKPDMPWLDGMIIYSLQQISDWKGFQGWRQRILDGVMAGRPVVSPFHLHALIDDLAIHRQASGIYGQTRYKKQPGFPAIRPYPRHERIRIAYVSSDFRDHPVAHLLAGLFTAHDRSRFDVCAVSLRTDPASPWHARIETTAEHFLDASQMSDHEIVRKLRDLEIDIAIDLNGFTDGGRTCIFAERAAPIQAHYIGYLGTMAMDYYDYMLADSVLVPENQQPEYTEAIAYLPAYQINDDQLASSARVFTRAECGLPENGFVFCSFNQTYKIVPDVFASWMRILNRVPGSVLWLHVVDDKALSNLRASAERLGVDGSRIIAASRIPLAEHLARQRLADLFLDTHPYNAGATASHALRMGLPLMTRPGQSFAARMGASLLTAVDMPELIVDSQDAYETLAIKLATEPEALAAIRRKLQANLPKSRLFDTRRAVGHLEALYEAMYKRLQAGLKPETIKVSNN